MLVKMARDFHYRGIQELGAMDVTKIGGKMSLIKFTLGLMSIRILNFVDRRYYNTDINIILCRDPITA